MSIETMKQWLEALEYPLNQTHENFNVDMAELLSHRAIESLRQAIEQSEQAEPIGASEETQWFAIQVEKLLCEKLGRKWSPSGISIQTLVDELADRQGQQAEPVAFDDWCRAWNATLKHTSPPPRQPLTDEEMFAIAKKIGFDSELMKLNHDRGMPSLAEQFARAIEAAHGIKGEA